MSREVTGENLRNVARMMCRELGAEGVVVVVIPHDRRVGVGAFVSDRLKPELSNILEQLSREPRVAGGGDVAMEELMEEIRRNGLCRVCHRQCWRDPGTKCAGQAARGGGGAA